LYNIVKKYIINIYINNKYKFDKYV